VKGSVAPSKIVGLIIVVIVIAVSLFFLTAVVDLELFFPSDITTLKQYSTCALAYCSAGADSDEVRAVGCLKKTAGQCEMSCLQVEEKVFNPDRYSFKDVFGRKHYCGSENSIPFEFDLSGISNTVDIRSGQMDTLARSPSWVCKSWEIFGQETDELVGRIFPNLPGLSSADWYYHGNVLGVSFPQNCLMLSKSVPDWQTYGNTLLFIGSFFVGGPETVAAGKAAIATVSSGAVTKAASGILVSTPPKIIAKTFVNIPGRGQVQKWTIEGIGKGVAAETGAGLVSVYDPLNFISLKTNGGCFSGFVYDDTDDDRPSNKNLLYTPLIQYQKGKEWQKVYPSAIYVDESFTDSSSGRAECEFINPSRARAKLAGEDITKIEEFKKAYVQDPANRARIEGILIEEKNDDGVTATRPPTGKEIDQILQSEAAAKAAAKFGGDDPIIGLDMYGPINQPFDYGNMLRECKFKKRDDRGRLIEYRVWASPTFPGVGTLNALSRGGYDVVDVEVADGQVVKKDSIDKILKGNETSTFLLNYITESIDDALDSIKKKTTEAFSSFGSCAYVTLSRNVESSRAEEAVVSPVTTSDTTQEIVTRLEIATDRKEYKSEETITITGLLEINGKPAVGREVTVDIIQFVIGREFYLAPRKVLTDENGAFVAETKFKLEATDTFQVVARYKGSKSEPYRFTVG